MRTRGMLRSVTTRTLRDARRAILGFALGLAFLTLMMGVFWPTIESQGEQFEQLVESYPPAMQAFFGGFSEFTTPAGFLRAELFSLMLPLVLVIFAIGRSADTLAGEEERGALETLLAHPISRRRAYLEKAAGVTLGVVAIVAVVAVCLLVIDVAFGMGVGPGGIFAACAMLLLYVLAHVGVTFAIVGARGRKGLAVAAATTFAVGSWLVASFGNLVDGLQPARALSVFAHYHDVHALRDGADPVGALVLAGVGLIGLGIGLVAFERRDLGV